MTKIIKRTNAKSKDSGIAQAYADMWGAFGIDNAPEYKSNWGKWPSIITDKGWEPANEVMRKHNFAVDNLPAFGNGYPGNSVNLNQINNLALDNVFLGWGELSLLQQNNIVNNLCVTLADAMTDKWIKFKSNNKSKRDKIRDLEAAVINFNLQEKMNIGLQRMLLLGTCYISPKLKGDEFDLKEPLLMSSAKIKQGDLEDIYFIEPTWVVPVEFNMINPRAPNFYKPQLFIVNGETIHASRMKRLIYIEPVNLTAPMYLFGGQPFIQSILPYILDFLNSKREIVKIVSKFNLSIINTDLNALHGKNAYGKCTTLAGTAKGRAHAFNALRNNFGILMLDKEEEFTQMQINVAGLTDILQQQGELLSLFSRIPVSKLFGQSPRGMNATGEFDANNFNEMIHTIQKAKLTQPLQYCLDLIQLDTFGEIDPEITFEFVPLGELNETTQSTLKNDKINRFTSLVNTGMADPVKLMEIAIADPDLDLTDYDNIIDENILNEQDEENDQKE